MTKEKTQRKSPGASRWACGIEIRDDCRLPLLAKLLRRLPATCCLEVTSFRSDALAKRGFGVLKMVRFSLHLALFERTVQIQLHHWFLFDLKRNHDMQPVYFAIKTGFISNKMGVARFSVMTS